MNWQDILKGKRGNTPTKLNFVERYGLDDDKFSTVNQVLTNMNERHSGKKAGNFNNNQLRSVLDKLVREGRAVKRPTQEKDLHKVREVMEYKKIILKAKVKAVETERYKIYSKFIKKVLKDEGGAVGMQGFVDAGNKLDGFDEKYLKYVISDVIDHKDWLAEHEHGDYYLKE